MNMKGVVQIPSSISFADGSESTVILGKQAEMLNSNLHSQLYTQCYRGNIFCASTTALGLAIPIYTGTGVTSTCLWNPLGSGKNLSILDVSWAYCSGTAVYSAVGLSYISGCGSSIATGASGGFTAFGTGTPINGLLGAGNVSIAKVSIAGTTTLGTAPATANWFKTIGNINLEAQTGTAHASTMTTYNPNGSIILPPGTAIWISSTVASSALYAQTITWAETPV